ncbi:MAG TPA: nitronate monooxygenase [Acidimicrobiales bacterium]|jgi:NAD(P)H-dependent flavin oxidoreductase YrpB (nitropropane dioxygenase family)
MDTAFTRLVGCPVPLQQAGMGGVAGPDLAVAVADAGALGMLGMPTVPAAGVADVLESVQQRTSGAVGINFLMPFVDREAVAAAAGRCRLVEFFYGDPDPALVALAHEGGALVAWQVGWADEARAAADAGCDLVVAQGVEAGGHVRGQVALLPLLEAVLEVVDVPVVAAGGIATARTMAAVLAAGAGAARVGTRFVATAEADAHPSYVDALIGAGPEDTVLTTTFSVMWPDAPHRVLRSCVEAAKAIADDVVGEMELPGGARVPVARLSPPGPGRHTSGNIDAMALYAGQSVGAVHRVDRAADVVRELAEGTEELLTRRH